MSVVLVFSITLFCAVLLSALAHRSVASTAVLFLVAGFIVGDGMMGYVVIDVGSPVLERLSEFALFAVLFTDGMELGLGRLRRNWQLPGRALGFGLPLTLLGTAAAAHYVAGLPWIPSLLVGAVLSPTDPVFASAIVERQEVPQRIRHLLNVESGLNDGLALPLVVGLISIAQHSDTHVGSLLLELAVGIILGVSVAYVASKLELRTELFSASEKYAPFFALSIGLAVFALAHLVLGNEYLASYFAGATLATVHPRLKQEFKGFGERLAELLKLGALLAFGSLISPQFLSELSWRGYVFGVIVLLLVRPVALQLAMWGETLSARERLTAFWFGPKGFASVVYGIMVLNAGIPSADVSFHLIAIVVAASILAHSSTDVLVARGFVRAGKDPNAGANRDAKEASQVP